MAQVFYVNLLKKPLIFFISSLQSLLFLENHCFRVLSTRFAEVRIEEYLLQKCFKFFNFSDFYHDFQDINLIHDPQEIWKTFLKQNNKPLFRQYFENENIANIFYYIVNKKNVCSNSHQL